MNIVVLIKAVPKSTSIKYNNDFTLSRNDGSFELNKSDTFAVEEALRLKEKCGGKVIAVSLGNHKCKKIMKQVLALGVDEAILVSDDCYRGSDTYATAYILSKMLQKIEDVSLVICGRKSSDGSTAQVPIEIAAMMDINFAANISECKVIENRLSCIEEYEHVRVKKSLSFPALITVALDMNIPRLPTVEGILKSNQSPIRIITNEELQIDSDACGIKGSLTKVVRTERLDNHTNRAQICCDINENIQKKLAKLLKDVSNEQKSITQELTEIDLTAEKKAKILVFCEVHNGKICEASLDIVQRAAYLANECDAQVVTVSTLTEDDVRTQEELSLLGVSTNYQLDIKDIYSENVDVVADGIMEAIFRASPKIVLFASTMKGMIYAPYLAAKTKSGLTADCIHLSISEGKLFQKRPAFGGKINAVILSHNSKYDVVSVKPHVEKIDYKIRKTNIKNIIICCPEKLHEAVEVKEKKNVQVERDVVIGIGIGIKNKKNVEKVIQFCEENHYGVCATREVVDNGWIAYDYQVGLTGKIIQPKLYIAIGISGANEHIVGVNLSEKIVSVNTDSREPICINSDFIFEIDSEEFINILLEV